MNVRAPNQANGDANGITNGTANGNRNGTASTGLWPKYSLFSNWKSNSKKEDIRPEAGEIIEKALP